MKPLRNHNIKMLAIITTIIILATLTIAAPRFGYTSISKELIGASKGFGYNAVPEKGFGYGQSEKGFGYDASGDSGFAYGGIEVLDNSTNSSFGYGGLK